LLKLRNIFEKAMKIIIIVINIGNGNKELRKRIIIICLGLC